MLVRRVRVGEEVGEQVGSVDRVASARTIRGSKVVMRGVLRDNMVLVRGYDLAVGLTGEFPASRLTVRETPPLESSGLPRVDEYLRGTAKGIVMASSMFREGEVDGNERGIGMLDDLAGRVLIVRYNGSLCSDCCQR